MTSHPHNLDVSAARQQIDTPLGRRTIYNPLALAQAHPVIHRLPYSLRILLESCLRNFDGYLVTADHIHAFLNYDPHRPPSIDIPFNPARVLLQDFTGVPCVVDLAAMRSAVARLGRDPRKINPLIPCDLVIDHSLQVDTFGTPQALTINSSLEFARNRERYTLLKWAQNAFSNFRVVPPATGIVHQVNLEYLAQVLWQTDRTLPSGDRETLLFPDSCLGTDSHTTMINGLGVLGWGVGGIEAEAVMLGQPYFMLIPPVVGVRLIGRLREGITATDLVLTLTQLLRQHNVVGKFVEFLGPALDQLSVADRATLANMAPEYGATCAFFPIDEQTLRYLQLTGRDARLIDTIRHYAQLTGLWRQPSTESQLAYAQVLELDLSSVTTSLAGPRRPQDRVDLSNMKTHWRRTLQEFLQQTSPSPPCGNTFEFPSFPISSQPAADVNPPPPPNSPNPPGEPGTSVPGYPRVPHTSFTPASPARQSADTSDFSQPSTPLGRAADVSPRVPSSASCDGLPPLGPAHQCGDASNLSSPATPYPSVPVELDGQRFYLTHGHVVIAAITSCTNTSNPDLMIAAGLLAQKAVALGLTRKPWVKTSLAPGSRVVTEYLTKSSLSQALDALGFNLVGYGCTTCIGNSGPLPEPISQAIRQHNLIVASVLSGNRNFEGRIHPDVRANYLASPPLVVAYALAGTIDIDWETEPIGLATRGPRQGQPVFLRDIWPSPQEIQEVLQRSISPQDFLKHYASVFDGTPDWQSIPVPTGDLYQWDPASTYIQEPPFFRDISAPPAAILPLRGARCLALLGDSVTTDHISPAGSIKPDSPAGRYLIEHGVRPSEFNSYGARRGNHHVMLRGTFANPRLKNLLLPDREGGFTIDFTDGHIKTIYDAAMSYKQAGVPLIILAGKDYGMGSSRDWAAKGTALLGVRAVIAESFERIHRSNLLGMGVLPLCFLPGQNARTLGLQGDEIFDIDLPADLKPRQELTVRAHKTDPASNHKILSTKTFHVICRLDSPVEIDYWRHGGILPMVLRKLAGL